MKISKEYKKFVHRMMLFFFSVVTKLYIQLQALRDDSERRKKLNLLQYEAVWYFFLTQYVPWFFMQSQWCVVFSIMAPQFNVTCHICCVCSCFFFFFFFFFFLLFIFSFFFWGGFTFVKSMILGFVYFSSLTVCNEIIMLT
jgi:hypothetical protein